MASSQPEPEAPADAPPPPPPEPLPQPEAKAEPVLPAQAGTWNLYELQKTVDAQTGVTPEQAEIWQAHLFFLREHASSDGSLPRSFDPLIGDVFGDVLERFPGRSTE